MAKFDELPEEIKLALKKTRKAMELFYTYPVKKRQDLLNRIHNFNKSNKL
ncbi:MAG: hypothetical protein N2Z65_03880 [Clostridiales bacterium]|nr:hypothetical protein [Clostridiales bacterium]